jgi:hypothetical protein
MWRNNKQNALLRFHVENGSANALFFLTLYYTTSLVAVLRAQNSSAVKTYSDLGFEIRASSYIQINQPTRCSNFSSLLLDNRTDHDQQHCYHHIPTVNQRLLL